MRRYHRANLAFLKHATLPPASAAPSFCAPLIGTITTASIRLHPRHLLPFRPYA